MNTKTIGYALLIIGVIALVIGAYMLFGMSFHGKAYAVLAVGVVMLVAGIVSAFVMRPKSTVA